MSINLGFLKGFRSLLFDTMEGEELERRSRGEEEVFRHGRELRLQPRAGGQEASLGRPRSDGGWRFSQYQARCRALPIWRQGHADRRWRVSLHSFWRFSPWFKGLLVLKSYRCRGFLELCIGQSSIFLLYPFCDNLKPRSNFQLCFSLLGRVDSLKITLL